MNFKGVKRSLLSLALTASMLVPQTAMAADVEVAGTESATQAVDVSMEIKSAYSVSMPATIELEYDAAKQVGDEVMEGYWYDLKYGVSGFIAANEHVYCRPVLPSTVTGEISGKVLSLIDPNVGPVYKQNFSSDDFVASTTGNATYSVMSDDYFEDFIEFVPSADTNSTGKISFVDCLSSAITEYTVDFDVKFEPTLSKTYIYLKDADDSSIFNLKREQDGTCEIIYDDVTMSDGEWYHCKLSVTEKDNGTASVETTITNSQSEIIFEKNYTTSNNVDISGLGNLQASFSAGNVGGSVSFDNVTITAENSKNGSCKIDWACDEVGSCTYDYATSTVSNCEYAYCCESGHPVGILVNDLEAADKYTGQITFEFGLEKN